MGDPGAISFEYGLRCTREHAFAAYTRRTGEWCDSHYSASPETLQSVSIEPYVVRRVYPTHSDIGEHDCDEITVWEPGRRLSHTFSLAQDPHHPTQVSVELADGVGDGCTVRFEHGGWTRETADVRAKFGDWPVMLDRFAAPAEAGR